MAKVTAEMADRAMQQCPILKGRQLIPKRPGCQNTGNATPILARPLTFHAASPIRPPSSSASGYRTHRDRALLLPQPPGHRHRDPPPRRRSPGLEPACTPLRKDRGTRKSQSVRDNVHSRGTGRCAEKAAGLGFGSQL